MSNLEKRFKVVQDANGYWGVLDTRAKKADEAFAPWSDWEKGGESWFSHWPDVFLWGETLNQARCISSSLLRSKREALYWVSYEPRREAK